MNAHLIPLRPRPRQAAFTLVEILVTLGICGLVVGGTLLFFVRSLNMYHYDSGKLLVNRDIRAFTSEMTDSATYANYFLIYPSFADRTTTVTVTDPEDPSATVNKTVDLAVSDGQSGDMLVLVYRDPDDDTKNSRIVGYYRSSDGEGGQGPVRKFEVAISPADSASIHSHLPAVSTAGTWPEVIELSRGLANGKLFYNFYDRSIMVKGQIFHRGSLTKRATNTYNFTVSPRG